MEKGQKNGGKGPERQKKVQHIINKCNQSRLEASDADICPRLARFMILIGNVSNQYEERGLI